MDNDLMKRVRHALGGQRELTSAQRVVSPPTPDLIRFPLWCSVHNRTSFVIARREGQSLVLLRNEAPAAAGGASRSGAGPMPLIGSFNFVDGGWPGCALCGAKRNERKGIGLVWLCEKASCGGPLHCVGDRGNLFRCACGIAADYDFSPVPSLPVRGTSGMPQGGASPRSPADAASRSGPALPTPTTTRLTYRGR